MIIRYEISLQKRKKRSKTMFACLELLKVSESVARRTGDLSAQVGRRVVCVAPCRLSKPVQAKSAPSMMKGENCPSKVRPTCANYRPSRADCLGCSLLSSLVAGIFLTLGSPFRLSTTPNMQTWFGTFFFLF